MDPYWGKLSQDSVKRKVDSMTRGYRLRLSEFSREDPGHTTNVAEFECQNRSLVRGEPNLQIRLIEAQDQPQFLANSVNGWFSIEQFRDLLLEKETAFWNQAPLQSQTACHIPSLLNTFPTVTNITDPVPIDEFTLIMSLRRGWWILYEFPECAVLSPSPGCRPFATWEMTDQGVVVCRSESLWLNREDYPKVYGTPNFPGLGTEVTLQEFQSCCKQFTVHGARGYRIPPIHLGFPGLESDDECD